MDGGPERAKMCSETNSRDLKVEKLELEQCLTAAGGVGGARV